MRLGVKVAEGDGSPRSVASVLGSERGMSLAEMVATCGSEVSVSMPSGDGYSSDDGRTANGGEDPNLVALLDGDPLAEPGRPLAGLTAETVEAEVTYGRYLARQAKDAASLRKDEEVALHPSLWPCQVLSS